MVRQRSWALQSTDAELVIRDHNRAVCRFGDVLKCRFKRPSRVTAVHSVHVFGSATPEARADTRCFPGRL